jgi:hypothetical protein
MCVDFCSLRTAVAEQGLNIAQIGTSFEQLGGKTMAQAVQTDGFFECQISSQHFQTLFGCWIHCTSHQRLLQRVILLACISSNNLATDGVSFLTEE